MIRTSIPSIRTVVIGLALTGAACSGAQKTQLTATPKTPAAEGHVETERTENKNTRVNLEVEHLAPPQAVATGATVYVVWAQPLVADAQPQNLGSFVVGEDRKGSLETVTPQRHFELLVTPEATGAVDRPTNEPVMKAKIAR